MDASWTQQAKQFKSRLSVVAGFLLRSRETQVKRANSYSEENRRLLKRMERLQRTIGELESQIAKNRIEINRSAFENQQLRMQSPILPKDPPLPDHAFGPKMISLCVNLARRIGLRSVSDVLKMVFDWLGVNAKLPDWTTV